IQDNFNGVGIFSACIKTANNLIKMAKNNAIQVGSPTFLKEAKRFKNHELSFLSENFMLESATYPDKPQYIKQIIASDAHDEITYIACEIANLIKMHGYHYNDFAIIARNLTSYTSIIRDIYDIPYFLDESYDIENNTLVSFILSALNVVQENFSTQSVIAYSKSPLLALTIEQSSKFEEYTYIWDIKKEGFLSPFKNSTNGFSNHTHSNDSNELENLNTIRNIIISPLLTLKSKLSNANGKQFALAIYEFLEESNVKVHLFSYAKTIPEQESKQLLEQCAMVWDILIDILDIFGEIFASYYFTSKRFCELFKLALCTAEIAMIPQTLDQVLVGLADRTRPNDPKVVFVIHAVDGVFPQTITQNTLFSTMQMEKLNQAGINFCDDDAYQTALEKYFAYYALTCPSERLYLSYPSQNLSGTTHIPSILVDTFSSLFPNSTVKTTDIDPLKQIINRKSAKAYLSKIVHQDTPTTVTLRSILTSEELQKIDYLSQSTPFKIEQMETAKLLFGSHLQISPSKLEQYHKCAFSYFCSSGLKLKKKKKVDFSPLESGTVIHTILQIILSKYNKEHLLSLSEKQLKDEIRTIINGYLQERIQDDSLLSKRFQYLFTRLISTTYKLIRHLQEEFLQSDFIPIDFELEIGQNPNASVTSLELVSQFGTKISVNGTVDRVDIMQKNGKKYVRVLDYKSGVKKFALSDIYHGLNLQMLVYLFSIWQNGTGIYKDAIPAGILYVPVPDKNIIVSTDRNTPQHTIAQEVSKTLKMNGLLLDDIVSISAMERDMAGIFIPATLKKDGSFDSASQLVTLTKLSKIKTHIEKIITNMADHLIQGEIPALPIKNNQFDPCSYCDYHSICGFESGDDIKDLKSFSTDEFYSMIGESKDA
ncbi:MAG: PD-(D/E)XK nuclease family protein, partial [Oscillospiraceae bacterium]